ncbi:N-acetylneuraminate synthase [Pseudorhodoplanes sp.]|uniref:N-acetylneuraminate synthase n=1 Tax=Pseudorhodoplanes sp. TaxID=1934341 RepID=UPI003D0FAEBD
MCANKVERTFVIAEAGVNHNGSVDMARRLVDAAVAAGADAVKFQSFRAENLVSGAAPRASYQERNDPGVKSQLEMLRKLELSEESQRMLRDHAAASGIEFMSSPFDPWSLDFLVDVLDVRRIKLGSGEITNGPLLLHAARKRRALILSTGMATIEEVEAALGVISFGLVSDEEPHGRSSFSTAFASDDGQAALSRHVTLLHCTSEYPAPIAEINLRAIDQLRKRFGLPTGFSDHSDGIVAAIAATARGAVAIEKHFTLDTSLPGPDHRASLEPKELAAMIAGIRQVELALGQERKGPTLSEQGTLPIARRSLVAARGISRGERIRPEDLAVKRPGTGKSPMEFWELVGTVAERDFRKDELL